MKLRIPFLAVIALLFTSIGKLDAQVTGVNYQLRYDTVDCEYQAYLVINSGQATTLFQSIQSNSQFSIVVPPGTAIGFPTSYNPTVLGGTTPTSWNPQNALTAATHNSNPNNNPINNDFYGFVPSLSPTSNYGNISAGDTILLFSFTISPSAGLCTAGVRLWQNGVDPNSNFLGGPNFNNGFTMGGPAQIYQANSPQRIPDNPNISAETTCNVGLEIDLTASASGCQIPLTYQWTGPNNYSETDQDVAIDPASMVNNGIYKVVVTDALGCKDSLEIEAIAKPMAGPDQSSCASSSITLTGSEPTTGVWSVVPTTGVTVGPSAGGMATGTFDATASGTYDFIYTVGNCADTTTVDVAVQDAGPNPSTINCNQTGTASLAGVGTGTWTVDPASAGTATIANPSSANTTVSDFSAGGTYILVWTLDGCSDSVTFLVNENCGCPIAGNTLVPASPNEFCGASGAFTINGNPATPTGTYAWQVSNNGGAFAAAAGANTGEDYTSGSLSTGNYTFRRIYSIAGAAPCSDTSNTVAILVKNIPAAPSNLVANPADLCLGETTALSVDAVTGATYTWSVSPTAGAGLGTSTIRTNNMTPTVAGTYVVSVFQTVNGCDSPPSTVTVVVNEVPDDLTPQDLLGIDPSACGVDDGQIQFSGLDPNATYTLNYRTGGVNLSATIVSNGAGVAVLDNLAAGTYNNFRLTNAAGCTNAVLISPITLSEPDSPEAPTGIVVDQTPECAGTTVTIRVDTLVGATYTWSASSPDAGLGSSTSPVITMNTDIPGQYTISVTQTLAGCTSPSASIGVVINGTPPTPDAGSINMMNPSACGASDGSITLLGLTPNTAYTLDYVDSGMPVVFSGSSTSSGSLTIPSLSEGSYTDFQLTNFTGCQSGVFPGPVSLSDPGSPDAPTNLTAMPNPICLGESINLSVDMNAGATFNWTANSANAGLGSSTTNTNTLVPTAAGVYNISVSQTLAGCTSPATSVEVSVLGVPMPIEAADVTATDPTVCSGADGTITIAGQTPGALMDLTYNFGGSPVTVSVTPNGLGEILLADLSAGTYSNFVLSNAAGCSSDPFSGPISLTDPNSPPAPAGIAADPNPACVGEEVSISVTNNPDATYAWTLTPAGSGALTVNGNMATFTIPSSGNFNVAVTQMVAGCTSAPAQITIFGTVSPAELEPGDFTAMSPSGCTLADGSLTISGLAASQNFFLQFDSLGITVNNQYFSNASGQITIVDLPAGSYSNFQLTNQSGCSSPVFAGPISIVDPGAPAAPANIAANPNPSCLGDQVTISVDPSAGAIFSWSANSPNAGLGTSTTNTITMDATIDGTYTISVFQDIAGCISPASMIQVVVGAIPTDDAVITGTDITVCGEADGTITISGLMANADYDLAYTFDGQAQTVAITANAQGAATISDLAIGTYTAFVLSNSAGCTSSPYDDIISLVGPDSPPAPTELTADPNPICVGETTALSALGESGATFTWNVSPANAGLGSSTTSTNNFTPTSAGVFTISVSQTASGCQSPSATVDVTVIPLPPTPTAGSVTGFDPSGCGQTDGSIQLTGYIGGETYTVTYNLDGTPTSIDVVADSNGRLAIGNLGAGTYTNFSVQSENGCQSGVFAGPINLVEPGAPESPTGLMASPNPVCLGNTVNLSVTTLPGATINWSISDQNGGLGTGGSNTNTMNPTAAGIYVVSVSQTINDCTSATAEISVLVLADCLNPDFGVTYAEVPLTGDLSTNDDQTPGSIYSSDVTASPANPDVCPVFVEPNGNYLFLCPTEGEYEYTVDVCNNDECISVPLVITVLDSTSTENPPVVNHDYATTNMNTPITIEILDNDECQSVPNCTLQNVSVVIQPENGSFNATTFEYVPQNGYVGLDSFRYEACQVPATIPACDQEWVYVTVLPGFATGYTNAMDDYDQVYTNTDLVATPETGVLSNDTDPQGNAQEAGAFTQTVPGKGTLVLDVDGSYVFTPATDFVGPVDFPYQTCRVANSTLCDSATLHILVTPAPDAGDITSIVWLDSNGDGRYNSGNEIGIPNVNVTLYDDAFGVVATTVTNASGIYTFESVIPGTYFAEFEQPVGLEVTVPNVGDELNDSDVDDTFGTGTTNLFSINAGETIESVKAGYFECVRIGDNVWYDVNKNDIFNVGENGINGLMVELWRNVGGTYELWDMVETGNKPGSPSDDGFYEFCTAPGTYYVKVIIPLTGLVQARPFRGSNPLRDSDLTDAFGKGTTNSFTVTAGNHKTDLGAGFYPQATVGNLVWHDENLDGIQNSFEERLSDVLVQAYDVESGDLLGESFTDAQGLYMIDQLEKRDIYLKFTPPEGMIATESRQGDDDAMDSDVDGSYGEMTTRMFSMVPDVGQENIDLGVTFGLLPVTWVDVAVKREGNAHEILWEVADQTNVESYVVQRLLEGETQFVNLEETTVSAFDGFAASYQAIDNDVYVDGQYYYRVKQLDIDGKYSYSDIVSIASDFKNELAVYPNPTTALLNVEVDANEGSNISVRISDNTGKVVKSKQYKSEAEGLFRASLDLRALQSGVYNVTVNTDGNTTNNKIVKID